MRWTLIRSSSIGKMRPKMSGGASNKANFGKFDKYVDSKFEKVQFHSNMEAKWKIMGWASIGSFFFIHKIFTLWPNTC